MRVGFYF